MNTVKNFFGRNVSALVALLALAVSSVSARADDGGLGAAASAAITSLGGNATLIATAAIGVMALVLGGIAVLGWMGVFGKRTR